MTLEKSNGSYITSATMAARSMESGAHSRKLLPFVFRKITVWMQMVYLAS